MSFDRRNKTADELDRLVGSTVAGKYHIDRLIGRGGMGAVFQATHAAIGKRVALKFLGAGASADADATTRFQREAQAASLAESPHIVQIFDAGRSEQGLPFLVMELLSGEDLRERLRREGRLEPSAAEQIATQILKALRQAHDAGIVHRDLKPDNVFLCRREGEASFVKIVDFGISKLERRASADTLTHQGAILGTAFYMSPEQAQSFPDIDGRTDLFSVGALLYEMLCGEPPHGGPTFEAVLIAICTRDAPDVRKSAPNVPDALANVVARALKRERSERYQSASDMLADLEASQVEGGFGSSASRTTTNVWIESASRRESAGRYRALVLAVVAALGGFAVAAYLVARAASVSSAPQPSTSAVAVASPLPAGEPSSSPIDAPGAETAQSSTPPKAMTRSSNKPKDFLKGSAKRPQSSGAGVASGLGLSTREP